MDTWQEEQLKRIQLGGNAPFKQFVTSYTPADQGGYKADASSYDRYHSWAAAQYKEKLDAMLAGRDWSASPPPPGYGNPSRSASPGPAAAQGLRKSRASARSVPNRSDSNSPSIRGSSSLGTPNPDQKTQNESYFASLGKANETRPDHLPPSQGGRYTGFGSTPTPPPNQNPLSSANAPTLTDLQENPAAAFSKGWSLFTAAVAGATKAVSDNVIQPGVEKVTDPNFQANVRGYMTEAQKKAASVGTAANGWSKTQFGVDVADTLGGAVSAVRERVAGPSRSGYGQLALTSPNEYGESSGLYSPDDTDDFFSEFDPKAKSPQESSLMPSTTGIATTTGPSSQQAKQVNKKKEDDWDDWKDF
ncbi:hypothetical protein MD484_g7125, partial [Candolleomyces efflorescens]